MLHYNEIALIFVWDAEVVQESVGGLAHDHGAEELATEPGTTTWGDTCLDDGNLEVRALLSELVGSAQSARACTDDDDVRLGIVVKVRKVATG